MSSLGKGIAASGLAALLQSRDYKVQLKKLDPYLNVDPGTMNPNQHGEVYVTNDGAETDLDLGHYERFTGVAAQQCDSFSSGQIYSDVIAQERRGDYLGATIQVIPHITDRIKEVILLGVNDDVDFLICEVGGTVGDIEGLPFLEAIRQFTNDVGRSRACHIHLTYIPYLPSARELKTKPSQHAVKELLHVGIQPDILLCRCDRPIPEESREKLALFCNMNKANVIEALDVDTIYSVPLNYAKAEFDLQIFKLFGMTPKQEPDLSKWSTFVTKWRAPQKNVQIAVVGKYTDVRDAYKSIIESFIHSGVAHGVNVCVHWIAAESLETKTGQSCPEKTAAALKDMAGILVPGGYGNRGIQGKFAAIKYAREMRIPFMGICLGMQLAVIEFARNVLGLTQAGTAEHKDTQLKLVDLMKTWTQGDTVISRTEHDNLGGTMRLGQYPCTLTPGTLAHKVYGSLHINERHRHRYEVNKDLMGAFAENGLIISGYSPDGKLPEMIEIPDHPWFLAMQFHPEFQSYPFNAHPVFQGFVGAAVLYETQNMLNKEGTQ